MEIRESNHEIMKRKMQLEFLKYDQEKMIKKFNLNSDSDYIYLEFVHSDYRINRQTGYVEGAKLGNQNYREADYNEAMTIYDLLCYSKDFCKASGEYTPMQNLSKVMTGDTYAGKGMTEKDAAFFDHKDELLASACEAIGGIKEGRGDVAYRIPIFQDLSMILSFWNSDEEFPASLHFFCDTNTLEYMHYETIWYVALHIIHKLRDTIQ